MTISRNVFRLLVSVTALATVGAEAADDPSLVSLINAYREKPDLCAGQQADPTGPLAPNEQLAQAQVHSAEQMQEALRQVGYQPAVARVIVLSGPADAAAAMKALRQRYCGELLSSRYAEIGVRHGNRHWQVILARPLLSPQLGDWEEAGKAVLKQVNQARASARTCGERSFEAASPLAWNARLGQAALAHSRDMAEHAYFSHTGRDGRHAGERARSAGYQGRRIGENIAAGQGSAEQAVSGWLTSPGHCANIMNPAFTEMGAAYAVNPQSEAVSYWTQVFGGR